MEAATPDAPLMVSISEAAQLKGVSRQTVHEKLHRLVGEGRIQTVRGKGREVRFSLAAYDLAVGETTDPARSIAQETAKAIRGEELPLLGAGAQEGGAAGRSSEYQDQLTRRARLDADQRQLELDKQMGRLLPVDDVTAAMERCAETIVRDLDQLVSHAEDLAAAVGRGGVAALRDELRKVVRGLRSTVEKSMTLLASEEDGESEDSA